MEFLHASPEDIVGTIRALLTGDQTVDIPFIRKQKANYHDHPHAAQIVAELDRMLGDIKARAEFEAILHEQRRRCDAMMREATAALNNGDRARAETILTNLASHDTIDSGWSTVWYDFQDPIERLYVEAVLMERREIREAPLPLVGVNQLLCAVLLQDHRPEEALRAIDDAIRMNKVAVMPRLERTYCLQQLGRWHELQRTLLDAFPLCWTQMHFGQWYRAMAPWFYQHDDMVGFGACLLLSLACAEDEAVRKMLEIAEQLSETAFDDEFAASVPEIARGRGIPVHPEPIWYDLAMRLGRQTLEDESFEQALRYLTVAHDLDRTPELLAQIERLRAHVKTLAESAGSPVPH